MKSNLWLLSLLSLCAFATDLKNSRFEHLSTQQGLSQKTVQVIHQDKLGFLWVGTQEGLNKFDGRSFKVFRHISNDPTTISHDTIRDITEDIQGFLWVATRGGLNKFERATETFQKVKVLSMGNRNVERLNKLFFDSKDRFWVGSDGDGIFYSDDSGQSFNSLSKPAELKDTEITEIFEDTRGRLWIGTDGKGVFLLSDSRQLIHHFNTSSLPPENSIGSDRIRSIVEDSRGKIWVGTRGGGISRFEELSKTFKTYRNVAQDESSLSHDRVYQIFEDIKNRLWIATDGGISVYDPSEDNFIRIKHYASQPSSLNNDRVLSIYQDEGGVIWVGTLAGLNRWNPNTAAFVHYRKITEDASSLSHNTVVALEQSSEDGIYIATYGGGLNYFDIRNQTFSIVANADDGELSENRLMTLMSDRDNNLWVGTRSKGVDVFSAQGKQKLHFEKTEAKDSLSANGITDILQDKDGDIWVSTYLAGLNKFDPDSKSFRHYTSNPETTNSLSKNNIYQLLEDEDGYLWIAYDGAGLSRFDKNDESFLHIQHDPSIPDSLSGNIIMSFFLDSKGRFWIGTQGNGLNRWEPEARRKGSNSFKKYSLSNGLNSNTVNAILEDDNGYIWISTNKGVSKIDPDTNDIVHFNLADEIHNNELIQGAALKAEDGRFYFGGLNGISAFYPDKVEQNKHVPPIVLTAVHSGNTQLSFNKPINQIDSLEFDHTDYLIAFEFAALDFAKPEKNRYQYKLSGFDDDWIDANTLNRATFTNLPSGNYMLQVKGSNNDGVWSDSSIELGIRINPAPWASWWAYSLYSMLFCLLLIYLIRHQAKRLADHQLFQDQVQQKVAQKTELYIKNNESLKDKLQQLKTSSLYHEKSGMFSQAAFIEFTIVVLKFIKTMNQKNAPDLRVMIAILNVDQSSCCESAMKTLYEKLNEQVAMVARWNSSQLVILSLINNASETREQAQRLISISSAVFKSEVPTSKVSMGYTVPLYDAENNDMEVETLLMLTEHATFSASKLEGEHFIGITEIFQPVTSVVLKQTVASDNIFELEGIYKIESDV